MASQAARKSNASIRLPLGSRTPRGWLDAKIASYTINSISIVNTLQLIKLEADRWIEAGAHGLHSITYET
jgi:hypothetical protein